MSQSTNIEAGALFQNVNYTDDELMRFEHESFALVLEVNSDEVIFLDCDGDVRKWLLETFVFVFERLDTLEVSQ